MSTSPVARVHRGVPTGGQFAAATHAEPSFQLNTPMPVDEVNRIAAIRDRYTGIRLLLEEIDPTSDEAKYLDRVHQHLSVQIVAAHALKHFPTATTLTIEQNDDGKAYDIVSVNNPGGRLDEGSKWNDDGIGDTDIPTYPEEAIWSLYLKTTAGPRALRRTAPTSATASDSTSTCAPP